MVKMPEAFTIAALVVLTLTAFGLYGLMHREINQEHMRRFIWLGPFALLLPGSLSWRGRFYCCALILVVVLTAAIMLTLFGPLPDWRAVKPVSSF